MAVLWLLVISLTFYVLMTARKPGRVLPASNTGLPVGAAFPQFAISSVSDKVPFATQHPKHNGTLVMFTSAHCPICNTVYPLIPLVEEKYRLKAQVIMEPLDEGNTESIMAKIHQMNITVPVFELTTSIRDAVKLEGFPFAYLLSQDGTVLSKGGINRLEDFDLLIRQGRRASFRIRKDSPGSVGSESGIPANPA